MLEHGEVIAEGVINVAFIAGTGGVGLVVSGTKTLAQYGTKVAIGFTFDVVIQAAVAKYFGEKEDEDISWEEAFTGINYLQATRSGAEALYDNAYASGALSCLGDLTIKGAAGELKVEDMPLECVTSFASSYLAEKAFKAGGGVFLMLKSKAVASPKHFAKGLKAIGLKDEQVEAFCKYLQLEEYTQKVLLQWKILRNEFLSGLQNKPPFKGNSSKLFDDFVADFADDPLKLANFEKTPSLVDSWASVKHVSDATRKNVSFLEKLDFLKGGNSKGLRDHIFIGDYKKVNGCHYYGAVDNVNVRFVDGVTPEANSLGVIKADIEMRRPIYDRGEIVDYRWTKKNTGQDPQTFFPSNWSQDEILEQCASAISNPKKKLVPGKARLWEGESDSGNFIRWYENADGSIPSIFPEF